MAAWTLRRFCKPSVLKEIRPEHLLAFLLPHREFLKSRGFLLPEPSRSSSLDDERLTEIFINPDVKTRAN